MSGARRPTVAMLSTGHRPDDTRVGVLARELAAAGWGVTMIMPGPRFEAGEEGNTFEEAPFEHRPIPIRRRNFGQGQSLPALGLALAELLLVPIRLLIEAWGTDADVFHCHELDTWAVGVVLALVRGGEVVVDIHEVQTAKADAFPERLRPFLRRSIRAVMRWLSRRTALVIHVSADRAALHRFLRSRRTAVVHTYRSLGECRPRWSRTAGRGGPLRIVHGGPLQPMYAAGEIAEALRMLSDRGREVRLISVGGTRYLTDEIREALAGLERDGIIEVRGRVPHGEVLDLVGGADLGLAVMLPLDTNLEHAVPRKFYEYIACGVPAICSESPEMRRILRRYGCGELLGTPSAGALAEVLERLDRDRDRIAAMAEGAREAAREEVNWERERELFLDAYRSVRRAL